MTKIADNIQIFMILERENYEISICQKCFKYFYLSYDPLKNWSVENVVYYYRFIIFGHSHSYLDYLLEQFGNDSIRF